MQENNIETAAYPAVNHAKTVAEFTENCQKAALDTSEPVDQMIKLASTDSLEELEKQILASDRPLEQKIQMLRDTQEMKHIDIQFAEDTVKRIADNQADNIIRIVSAFFDKASQAAPVIALCGAYFWMAKKKPKLMLNTIRSALLPGSVA